jgi:crossover junction endodeoxyribonuclease RusA
MTQFKCNYPPSLNSYYKHYRGRVVISDKGREYHQHIADIYEKETKFTNEIVEMTIKLYPPDRRRRDVDNVLKCLLDSITRASGWNDDSQVKRLIVERFDPVKGGSCEVIIREIEK